MSLARRTAAVAVAAAIATAASTVLLAPASTARQPAREPGPTSYSEAGPYAVGERTMTLRSGVKVEVWYPARNADVEGLPPATYDVADWLPSFLVPEGGVSVTHPSGGVRGVPVAKRRFPLVVFSHGFAGFRTQSSALTSAMASWGFVVAAPDHPSRNLTQVMLGPAGTTSDGQDLRQTITLLTTKATTQGHWLQGRVDIDRIGAVGHSAGGRAVEALARTDRRVDTYVGMAPAVGESPVVTKKPVLMLVGTADGIIAQERIDQAYDVLRAPKRIVYFEGSGHLAFSDLCEIGDADGGLLSLAAAVGITVPDRLVPLATDGCLPPAVEPTLAWPAIHHVIVAHLRRAFGIDDSDAALTGLDAAYPGIISGERSGR